MRDFLSLMFEMMPEYLNVPSFEGEYTHTHTWGHADFGDFVKDSKPLAKRGRGLHRVSFSGKNWTNKQINKE